MPTEAACLTVLGAYGRTCLTGPQLTTLRKVTALQGREAALKSSCAPEQKSEPKPPKWGSLKASSNPNACILPHAIGSKLPVTRPTATSPRACTDLYTQLLCGPHTPINS